jgi:hypothetical protein
MAASTASGSKWSCITRQPPIASTTAVKKTPAEWYMGQTTRWRSRRAMGNCDRKLKMGRMPTRRISRVAPLARPVVPEV